MTERHAVAAELMIFDCDGVLVDSEVIADRVVEAELIARLPGVPVSSLLEDMVGFTTETILNGVAQRAGVVLPADTLKTVEAAIDAALAEEVQAIPGVAGALARIALPKAVASNSSAARIRISLERAGLMRAVGERVFSAAMVARPKPAPDLYRLIASTLAVAPPRCLVVEDSVPGVTAATAAGMPVIGFVGASHVAADQAQRLRRAGAVTVIEDMARLPDLVDDWGRG